MGEENEPVWPYVVYADIPPDDMNEWNYPHKDIWIFCGYVHRLGTTLWLKRGIEEELNTTDSDSSTEGGEK